MAVVMLIKIVSLQLRHAGTWLWFGGHMMASVAAKQLAFRLSRYNGFGWVRRPAFRSDLCMAGRRSRDKPEAEKTYDLDLSDR
jgi:hypothetical protein